MKKQPKKGFVLWFTGLSGAGKSTVANKVLDILSDQGYTRLERLDGDIVREDLTKDLGFTHEDRMTNIKRVSFVADMLSRNGIGVISSFISPYISSREYVDNRVTNYIEVFVNASIETCEDRDVKGLYKQAREGKIENFTGISDPYENPENPDIELKTADETIKQSALKVVEYLKDNQYI